MRKTLLLALILLMIGDMSAQNATIAWNKILKNCANSDLIGKQSLFFGVSNTIGPGSVWRRADDNSIRLIFELSDAFPSATDQAKIVKVNKTVGCFGSSSSKWNLKVGLPFATGATSLSLDIGALLGQAKAVTVSVTGVAVDDLDEANWKQAFIGLGADNTYYKELHNDGRLLAENAVKVTGLKAVFNYKTDLSADVQAKFKGKVFTLGNSSSSPGSSSATAEPNSTASTTSTPPGNQTGANGANGSGASGSSCSPSNTADSSAGNGNAAPGGGSPGTGSATLHVDFTSSRQITICADGPFYLIAAYSQLVGGTPIGIVPTAETVALTPATLPKRAVAASDRKASDSQ
jgi:hypothetical protein